MDQPPRVALVQDGARGHYGLAIALQRAGILERIYTDWYAAPQSFTGRLSRLAAHFSKGLGRRLAGRNNPELDSTRVFFSPLLAARLAAGRLRRRRITEYFEWNSAVTAAWIRRRGFSKATALMGFIRNIDPDLCQAARDAGLLVVGDQMIAPAAIELQEALIQAERFPGWEQAPMTAELREIDAYERRTWARLDHVTCPSDYVRDGLLAQGVSPQKVTTVPYAVDETTFTMPDRTERRDGPLLVGFVGAVNLRKGVPYFLQVAQRFDPRQVRFVMIGPAAIKTQVLEAHRGHVELLGQVPRSHIHEWFQKFDLFFFPTTCEGSAYALMEAMACGLPVVSSPNSGTVARHGVEGFIAAYDALDEFAAHIERLRSDRELRLEMGRAARRRYEQFGLNAYSGAFASLFGRLHSEPKAATPAFAPT